MRHNKIIMILAGVELLIVASLMWVSFVAFDQMQTAAAARKQAYVTINTAHTLLAELIDAEAGQRGYLLTFDKTYLEHYLAVREQIRGSLENLRRRVQADAAQKPMDEMITMADTKMQYLSDSIELRNSKGISAAIKNMRRGEGKELMDEIRVEMAAFVQAEEDALALREAEFRTNMRGMFAAILTVSILMMLFAFFLAYLIWKESGNQFKNLVGFETKRLFDMQERTNDKLVHANAVLQDSEEKFAVTINSIGDGVMATDIKGRVTLLNLVAEELTGWTTAQAQGHMSDEVFKIVNEETRKTVLNPVKKALDNGTAQGLANHTILIARSGVEHHIADSCAPIRNRDGKVAGAVLVFRDVGGQREKDIGLEKARKELVEIRVQEDAAREYSQSIIDTVRESLIILDQDLRVLSVSRSFYEAFKARPEDTVGQLIYDLGNKQWDIPKLRELLEKILPLQTTFNNYEVEHDFADIGRRTMLLNARQIKRVFGKESIILLAIEDITERRNAEQVLEKFNLSLQVSEEKLDITLNSIGDAVLATDSQGNITLLNPIAESLTGWSQAEAMGMKSETVFHILEEDGRQPSVNPVTKTLSDGTIQTLANHTVLISRDGKEYNIADSCAPILSREGLIVGAVLVFRDITDQRNMEIGMETVRKELVCARVVEDESSEYSESIINTVRESLIVLDRDLRVVSVSRSFYDFFKVKPKETIGQLIYDLGNKQWDIPKLRELLENILPEKTAFANYEVEHDFATIGRRIMLLNARQIERALGKEKVILLAIEDITERRNSVEILEKFNLTLRAISSSNQALMHAKNEEDFLKKVCNIIVRDRGYKLAWIGFAQHNEGKTITPAAMSGHENEYINNLDITWGEGKRGLYPAGVAIRSGKVAVCKNMAVDENLKIWSREAKAHGYVSMIALPLRSVGSVFGALMLYSEEADMFTSAEVTLLEELAFDISYGIMLIRIREKNKHVEAEVKKIAAFPFLDPNPISEVDVFGKIHYMNPAFVKMFTGDTSVPLRHAWFKGITSLFWVLKGARKKIVNREAQVEDKTFLQTLVYMPGDKTVRTYGVDITQRKKAENELKRINDEMEAKVQQRTSELLASRHLADLGTLAATVAHELRNPLGVINVAVYNLRRKAKLKAKYLLGHIANIEKKVLESGQIINNLLVYSKMKMPQFEETDVFALVSECAASVKKNFNGKKIIFGNKMQSIKGLLIEADPLQLKEIFVNLITNAYQSIEAGPGKVTLNASVKKGNLAVISVKDTGVGISKEDMANIFKPFFTRKTKGTGLGLVICKDLITMHNGTIDIKSRPGKGTTFAIALPIRRS